MELLGTGFEFSKERAPTPAIALGSQGRPHTGAMEDAGVDEVARWLVDSAHLPQYEQAFRDNEVDGDMLLELVARDVLGELVESRLHQCRGPALAADHV